jgi:hypothetical protein
MFVRFDDRVATNGYVHGKSPIWSVGRNTERDITEWDKVDVAAAGAASCSCVKAGTGQRDS